MLMVGTAVDDDADADADADDDAIGPLLLVPKRPLAPLAVEGGVLAMVMIIDGFVGSHVLFSWAMEICNADLQPPLFTDILIKHLDRFIRSLS